MCRALSQIWRSIRPTTPFQSLPARNCSVDPTRTVRPKPEMDAPPPPPFWAVSRRLGAGSPSYAGASPSSAPQLSPESHVVTDARGQQLDGMSIRPDGPHHALELFLHGREDVLDVIPLVEYLAEGSGAFLEKPQHLRPGAISFDFVVGSGLNYEAASAVFFALQFSTPYWVSAGT